MRKWMIAGLVPIVIAALAAVAVWNLDSYLNRNREWLAKRVELALGRKVTFERIGVSLARGLAVRVEGLSVADDPRFADGELVRARSAYVRVRLLPALFGRYEIADVTLVEPVLNVVKTTAGYNFATLGGAGKTEAPQETAATAAFTIASLEMENGALHYRDRTAKPEARLDVEQVDLSASDVGMVAPIEFELSAAALGAKDQNVHVQGKLGPLDAKTSDDVPIDVALRVDGLSVDALAGVAEIASSLPAGLKTEGPLSLDGKAAGRLGAVHVTGALDAKDARVRYADLFDKPRGVALSAEIDADQRPDAVDLKRARITLADARVDASGKITPGDATRYALAVSSNAIPLGSLAALLPALAGTDLGGTAELRDVAVAGATGVEPTLRGAVSLADVSVRRADLPAIEALNLIAKLEGRSIVVPSAPFRLAGSPATLEARVPSIEPLQATFALGAQTMPLSLLGLTAGADAQDLRNVRVAGTYDGLRVRLDPVTALAFGGAVDAAASYTMAEPPAFTVTSKLRDVRIADMLATFGKAPASLLVGLAAGDLSVSGSGSDWAALAPTLSGGSRLELRDGAVEGVNLVDGVLTGLTGVPGLSALVTPEIRVKYPRLFASNRTAFETLRANTRIAGQKLVIEELSLRAPEFAIAAKGEMGFDQSVALDATLELSEALSRDLVTRVQLASHLADPAGRVRIPFKLAGVAPALKPQPDLDVVASALRGAAVGKALDALVPKKAKKDEAAAPDDGDARAPRDAVSEGIQRGIEGLFGR